MLQFLDTIFNDSVNIKDEDAVFAGCEFKAQGTGKKDSTKLGLKLVGSASADVSNCVFASQGYSAIGVQTSGKVVIDNCEFHCENNHNPIECTVQSGAAVEDVTVSNNKFTGICGNNYVNFYKVADGSVFTIEGNEFIDISPESEVIRFSNVENTSATFEVKNNSYNFYTTEGTSDYTSFIMCQDFTAKNGKPEDFTKYTVNIENLRCNGQPVGEDRKCAQGVLTFTYQDGVGIITDNDPVINIK